MAAETIFTVEADGSLTRMNLSAPETEARMQELVARYPELIVDDAGDLLLIRREHPISDSEDTGGRWSLDHLFVTKNAIPVLVELKRAVDTRLRREVVGQMLDYAANAQAYWRAGTVANAFALTAEELEIDADLMLGKFLGDREPQDFWDQVDSNFRAGKFRLVFVADIIPKELVRIVEFLNEHMNIDVRAIELQWFASHDGRTSLVPRVMGSSVRSSDMKSRASDLKPISVDEWIEQNLLPYGQATAVAARAVVDFVESIGGSAGVTSTQGSIYLKFRGSGTREFYPMQLSRSGRGRAYLNLYLLKKECSYIDERARRILYDQLTEIVGPLSTQTLDGSPGFQIEVLENAGVMVEFEGLLEKLVNTVRAR